MNNPEKTNRMIDKICDILSDGDLVKVLDAIMTYMNDDEYYRIVEEIRQNWRADNSIDRIFNDCFELKFDDEGNRIK